MIQEELQESLLTHPNMVREMNAGRVLIVQHQGQCNKLGVLLSTDSRSKEKLYKMLVLLGDSDAPMVDESSCTKIYGLSQIERGLYYPAFKVNHTIVSIKAKAIWEVTKIHLKIEADKIISDWDNRQIPRFRSVLAVKQLRMPSNTINDTITNRLYSNVLNILSTLKALNFIFSFTFYFSIPFRDNPPGPSCTSAVQELSRLSQNPSIEIISPLQDWKWNSMELVSKLQELTILRSRLSAALCTACSQFEDHVRFY